MDHHSVAYVGFDTSKTKHAVAVAESGREGEVGCRGEIETSPRPLSSFCISCW